jgi:CheY-like chemotaxis protein/DNA-binding MarR family transcriptional regulator
MQLPKKILVVDDDPVARHYLVHVLVGAGFACVATASGREALARIEYDREVSVVVSDVVMPGLDGVRLGRYIRDRFPDRTWLQMLFVTGHPQLDIAVSALRLGAVDYLSKPVAPAELVLAVGRALAASHAIARSLPPGGASPPAPADGLEREAAAESSLGADAAARSALECLTALRRLRQESGVLAGLDEASWTILLELYHAEITRRRLSVSKLCALDEASQTTAWRRIRSMEKRGLLVRDQDPVDARRSFVVLTDAAVHAVTEFVSRANGVVANGV